MSKYPRTALLMFLVIVLSPIWPSQAIAAPPTTTTPEPKTAALPTAVTAGKSPATPDPKANPVLAQVIQYGAKLFYLGNAAGLDGWFIMNDGRIQVAYSTPDGQHATFGALFGPNGENITSNQMLELLKNHPEISDILKDENNKPAETGGISTPLPGATPVTNSPGEKLYGQLAVAKGVTVGVNLSAPLVMMVIDPNCPHCQATWRMLRDYVLKGFIQVRLIPIGNENSDSERAAAVLLHVRNPLDAWNKYVDGDKSQLAGTPDKNFILATQSSHMLVDSWSLRSIPIIVYIAKDGTVKITQGEPKNTDAMISDMGATAPVAPSAP